MNVKKNHIGVIIFHTGRVYRSADFSVWNIQDDL